MQQNQQSETIDIQTPQAENPKNLPFKTPPRQQTHQRRQTQGYQQQRENMKKAALNSGKSLKQQAPSPSQKSLGERKSVLKEQNLNRQSLANYGTASSNDFQHEIPESSTNGGNVSRPTTSSQNKSISRTQREEIAKRSRSKSLKSARKRMDQSMRQTQINTLVNQQQVFHETQEELEATLSQEHLKSAIRALHEKLKFYQNIDQEKEESESRVKELQAVREELQQQIQETAERLEEDGQKSVKYQKILIEENKSLSEQILQLTQMYSQKGQECDQFRRELLENKASHERLELQFENMKDYEVKYQREANRAQKLERDLENLREQLSEKSNQYSEAVDQVVEEKQKVVEQNQDLRERMQEMQKQLDSLRTCKDALESEMRQKDADLENYCLKLEHLDEIQDQNEILQEEVQKSHSEREALTQKIEKVVSSQREMTQQLKDENERVETERQNLNEQLNELFSEKSEKDVIIKTLTNEILELNQRSKALEQLLIAKEERESQKDQMQEQLGKTGKNKEKYKKDLEICTNYLLEVEEKCQEAQNTSLELLGQLKDREADIEKLTEMVTQLQENQGLPAIFYKPVKNDLVDEKLAQYINQAPAKLRAHMNFIRESEGIYKYGRKRVFMKIEKDHIIIRVGGGYLTVDDFIEQYCDESRKQQVYNWMYQGECKGQQSFKQFQFTHKEQDDNAGTAETEDHAHQEFVEMSYERQSDNEDEQN